MSAAKRILFIPSLYYLSNPVFSAIAKSLKGCECYYLDADYYNNAKFISNKEEVFKTLSDTFHRIETVNEEAVIEQTGVIGKIKMLRQEGVRYKASRAAIDKINPDVIVLGADGPDIYKVCNTYFKHKKIFVVQQGSLYKISRPKHTLKQKISYLIYRNVFGALLYPYNPLKGYRNHSTHLLWSDFFMLNPDIKYQATGNPALDPILAEFKENTAYSETRRIVCFATQPLNEELGWPMFNEILDIVKTGLRGLADSEVLVKVHPREDITFYQNLLPKDEFPHITIVKEGLMNDILAKSFVLVTASSGTSYEAVAKGIPCVIINPNGKLDYSYRYPDNTYPIVCTPEEIVAKVNEFKTPEGYRAFIDNRIYTLKQINTYATPVSAQKAAEAILS